MIIIIIYLIGCVLNYILLRKYIKMDDFIYTISDRFMNLLQSLMSWAGVIASLLCLFCTYENNKPAKW